jgi:tetratricopeptide (TPR) repeat protein
MGAVTYPDEKVIAFVTNNVVPLQVPSDSKLAAEFKVKWTPTLATLDPEGKECHRTLGFLAPDELIPSVMLGIGKTFFEAGVFDKAISAFDKLLDEYDESSSATEAIFLRGVSLYKHTGDPNNLRKAYDLLSTEYPDDEWTKRAYPYRLIA